MRNIFVILTLLFLSLPTFAGVAVVKIMKGEASSKMNNQITSLKVDQWVDEGMIIITGDKSFVRLVFVDKSTMNIGPKSEVKIEKFNGKEASVFDLVKGQIRSNVSKDYLQNPDKDKSKLFIKTKNAVMGVRGTDFLITRFDRSTSNFENSSTSLVLFEGEVVLNSLPPAIRDPGNGLEDIVNSGVRVLPGEFSVVKDDFPQPTVPVRLNVKQLELLEKNETFSAAKREPAGNETPKPRSIIPKGLSGEIVSHDSSESLKKNTDSTTSTETSLEPSLARGFKEGDKIQPASGSFIHLESGTIIPPANDAIWDSNSQTFIASTSNGGVNSDGSFLPPEGIMINEEGKFLATTGNQLVEISPPEPVMNESSLSLREIASSSENFQLPPVLPNVNSNEINPYASPAQTNYSTSAPTETQVINQINKGSLNITIIER